MKDKSAKTLKPKYKLITKYHLQEFISESVFSIKKNFKYSEYLKDFPVQNLKHKPHSSFINTRHITFINFF